MKNSVEKYNTRHDAKGRFSSGPSGGTPMVTGAKKALFGNSLKTSGGDHVVLDNAIADALPLDGMEGPFLEDFFGRPLAPSASSKREAVNRISQAWNRNSNKWVTSDMQRSAAKLWGGEDITPVNRAFTESNPLIEGYLSATYKRTQGYLKVNAPGVSTIRMYRGMTGGMGGVQADNARPLSSWSIIEAKAKAFTFSGFGGFAQIDGSSVLVTADIPVSDIVSIGGVTGFGARSEGEIVVRAHSLSGKVTAFWPNGEKTTRVVKYNRNHDAKGRFTSGVGGVASRLKVSGPVREWKAPNGSMVTYRTSGTYTDLVGKVREIELFERHDHKAGRGFVPANVSVTMDPLDGFAGSAQLSLWAEEQGNPGWTINSVEVWNSSDRRKGIATALLTFARQNVKDGAPVSHSIVLLPDGEAWSAVAKYNRNHDAKGRFSSGTVGAESWDNVRVRSNTDYGNEIAQLTFSAIEKVHGIRGISEIQLAVHQAGTEPVKGAEGWYVPGTSTVNVGTGAYNPTFVVAHEFGHLLDNEVLRPGSTTSAYMGYDPHYVGVSAALKASPTIKKLDADLSPAREVYLLSEPEKFARAYTQWVAIRSGDAELIRAVADERRAVPGSQWPDAEFTPIAEAMDGLFAQKGLIAAPVVKFNPNHSYPPEDHEVSVEKYNRNHDADGRFTTSDGGKVDLFEDRSNEVDRLDINRDIAKRMTALGVTQVDAYVAAAKYEPSDASRSRFEQKKEAAFDEADRLLAQSYFGKDGVTFGVDYDGRIITLSVAMQGGTRGGIVLMPGATRADYEAAMTERLNLSAAEVIGETWRARSNYGTSLKLQEAATYSLGSYGITLEKYDPGAARYLMTREGGADETITEELMSAYAVSVHGQTQDYLKAKGITSVSAYRGLRVNAGDTTVVPVGDAVKFTQRPLSSWTTSVRTASQFSRESDAGGSTGYIITREIKAEDIFSIGGITGPAVPGESEIVAMVPLDDVVKVEQANLDGFVEKAEGELVFTAALLADSYPPEDHDVSVEKYNRNHGPNGRFTSGPSGDVAGTSAKSREVQARMGATKAETGSAYDGDWQKTATYASGDKAYVLTLGVRPGYRPGDTEVKVMAHPDATNNVRISQMIIDSGKNSGVIGIVQVHPDHRRQGLATAMLEFARRESVVPINHDTPDLRSSDGDAFANVVKYNRNHGPDGRFTSGPGGGAVGLIDTSTLHGGQFDIEHITDPSIAKTFLWERNGIEDNFGTTAIAARHRVEDAAIAADIATRATPELDAQATMIAGGISAASGRPMSFQDLAAEATPERPLMVWENSAGYVASYTYEMGEELYRVTNPAQADAILREATYTRAVSKISADWNKSSHRGWSPAMHESADRVFGLKDSLSHAGANTISGNDFEQVGVSARMVDGTVGFLDEYTRSTYKNTQSLIAAQVDGSIKTVRAYRGMALKDVVDGDVRMPLPGTTAKGGVAVDIQDRPLASWSISKNSASAFAWSDPFSGVSGYVNTQDIPVADIFSIGGIGPGAASEHELIVIGRPNPTSTLEIKRGN